MPEKVRSPKAIPKRWKISLKSLKITLKSLKTISEQSQIYPKNLKTISAKSQNSPYKVYRSFLKFSINVIFSLDVSKLFLKSIFETFPDHVFPTMLFRPCFYPTMFLPDHVIPTMLFRPCFSDHVNSDHVIPTMLFRPCYYRTPLKLEKNF